MARSARSTGPRHPRYQISRRLGSGGAGAVWLAKDRLEDRREVALKVSHHAVEPQSLLREFRLLRDLRHPGVARAWDFGHLPETGQAYLAMEYVAGPDLDRRAVELRRMLQSGRFSEVVEILLQIVRALGYVHARGLLHLDLKPRNIVFASGRAKLIDFGIFENVCETAARGARGTVYYTAPEVFEGRAVDARADLYSLGVTIYRVLSGRYPITGRTIAEVAANHKQALPPPPRGLPEELGRIASKLLAKSPQHRFQSAEELESALVALLPRESPAAAGALHREPDFAGRRVELRWFFDWLEEADPGSDRVLAVEGPAGIGKSRFVETCVTELLASDHCVIELVEDDVVRGGALRRLVEKILHTWGNRVRDRSRYRFVLTSLGLASDSSARREIDSLDLEQVRARAFRELTELVSAAVSRPVVIVIDGWHSADAQLADFVERIARAGRASTGGEKRNEPLRALVTCRRDRGSQGDEDAAARLDAAGVRRVVLPPLETSELARSTEELEPVLGRATLREIARASGGNPRRFVELLWSALPGNPPEIAAAGPSSGPIAPQFAPDELASSAERAIVLALAVAGGPQPGAVLLEATSLGRAAFRRARDRLAERGILRSSPRGFGLGTGLAAVDLIAGFPEAEVIATRERFAALLAERGESPAELARQLWALGRDEPALDAAARAVELFRSTGRLEEAIEISAECLARRPAPAVRRKWLERSGDLLSPAGRFDEARDAYGTLLADPELSREDEPRVLRKLGGIHQRAGNTEAAREAFEEALARLEEVDAPDEHLHVLNELAALALFGGDFARSMTFANRGLEVLDSLAEGALEPDARASHELNLRSVAAHILLRRFEHDRAAEVFRHTLDIAERLGSVSSAALILNNLGIAYYQGNRLREGLETYGRAEELAERLGDETALFSIRCNLAVIRARLGDVARAEETLARILEMPHPASSRRARLFLVYTRGLVARVTLRDSRDDWQEAARLADELPDPLLGRYARLYFAENEIVHGRWKDARGFLEELESSGPHDARLARGIGVRKAWLEALVGKRSSAGGLLDEGIEVLGDRDSGVPDHGVLSDELIALAALLECGDRDRVISRLERARSIFAELGQSPGVLECDLLLADAALRTRDRSAALASLRSARRLIARDPAARSARAALVRLPWLEARLALLANPPSPTLVADRAVDAAGNLPPRATSEIVWLLELLASGSAGEGRRRLEHARRKFLQQIAPEDRESYASRDHRVRLGIGEATEDSRPEREAATLAPLDRLEALEAIAVARDARGALEALLAAVGSTGGAIFVQGSEERGADLEAGDLLGEASVTHLRRVLFSKGGGRVENGFAAELERDLTPAGFVWVRSPPIAESDVGIRSFHIGAALLASSLARLEFRGGRSASRDTLPLVIEAAERTQTLVDSAMVESRAPRVREVVALARRTRDSLLPVLLTGESGSGKDVLARWIHTQSPRCEEAFYAISCSAIPDELFEAELFGHEAGAFTGASVKSPGYLVAAGKGTLYLDNVDALSLAAQSKLLRALETREVRPIGGNEPIRVEARFIASAQEKLEDLCASGRFRRDLYYRLAGICLHLPPLRERLEDLPALVEHFVRQSTRGRVELRPESFEVLRAHAWPGNLRELETLIRRLSLTVEGAVGREEVVAALGLAAAPPSMPRWFFQGKSFEGVIEEVKREYLLWVFDRAGGDVNEMAREMKTTRRNVYQRLTQAGLRASDLRTRSPGSAAQGDAAG